jgi:hypothetical protein
MSGSAILGKAIVRSEPQARAVFPDKLRRSQWISRPYTALKRTAGAGKPVLSGIDAALLRR